MSAATLERIRGALSGLEYEVVEANDAMPTLVVPAADVRETMTRLKEAAEFGACTIVTAVDHLPAEPRFEMVWQLLSIAARDRVRVKCRLPEEAPKVASVSSLWPGARFFERECWDLFGIRFEGLADHRRLMMPEGFTHHPLRKDFPHRGIDPGRLYREWDRERRERETAADRADAAEIAPDLQPEG